MNNTLRDPDKITMTHTGLLPGKKGKLIHVSFERKTERGRDYAELVLPSRNVLSSKGFDDGELVHLQLYQNHLRILKSQNNIRSEDRYCLLIFLYVKSHAITHGLNDFLYSHNVCIFFIMF